MTASQTGHLHIYPTIDSLLSDEPHCVRESRLDTFTKFATSLSYPVAENLLEIYSLYTEVHHALQASLYEADNYTYNGASLQIPKTVFK